MNYIEMNCLKSHIIKNVMIKIPIIIAVLKPGFISLLNATDAKPCDISVILNNILQSKQSDRHILKDSGLNERLIFFMEKSKSIKYWIINIRKKNDHHNVLFLFLISSKIYVYKGKVGFWSVFHL